MSKCDMQCLYFGCPGRCKLIKDHLEIHECSHDSNHTWSSWFQGTCKEYCPVCNKEGVYKNCMYPSPHVYKHKGDCGHEWWGWE